MGRRSNGSPRDLHVAVFLLLCPGHKAQRDADLKQQRMAVTLSLRCAACGTVGSSCSACAGGCGSLLVCNGANQCGTMLEAASYGAGLARDTSWRTMCCIAFKNLLSRSLLMLTAAGAPSSCLPARDPVADKSSAFTAEGSVCGLQRHFCRSFSIMLKYAVVHFLLPGMLGSPCRN